MNIELILMIIGGLYLLIGMIIAQKTSGYLLACIFDPGYFWAMTFFYPILIVILRKKQKNL